MNKLKNAYRIKWLLWFVICLSLLFLVLNPKYRNGERDVVIYTTDWRPYCSALKRCLRESRIPFVEKDIEKSTLAMAEQMSLFRVGVPTTLIGKEVVVGLNAERLTNLLEGAGYKVQCGLIEALTP